MTSTSNARRPTGRVLLAVLAGIVVVASSSPARNAVAQPTSASPSPGAAGAASGAAAQPPAESAAALPGQLDAVVARMGDLVGAATVSAVVTDDQGETIWSAGPDRGLVPASTMKVLTAASVIDELGLSGVVPTGVAATAPVNDQGVVDGDVVVVGNGDPTLTTEEYRRWIYPARPSTAIEDLADVIVAAGVRRITGSLVGDGTRFGPADAASGWPSHYFADLDAHHITALTVDAGWDLVAPGGGPPGIVQAEDPARRATRLLARALADRGVVIEGRARRSRAPRAGVFPLGRVVSPTMDTVVGFMLRESDNHLADTLVRTSALRETGDGSWAAAGRRLRTALVDLGVETTGLVVADGSGLSRNNRVSPRQLVAADVGLTNRLGDSWSSMLAVAGESGTLEHRLVGTAAQGRVHAKTGTLVDVRALVGHVVGEGGARYHFAMMVNDVDENIRYLASVLGDEISLALVDAVDGCARVREVASPPGQDEEAASDGPTPATVLAAPSAADPGPYLSDPSWRRRCPAR